MTANPFRNGTGTNPYDMPIAPGGHGNGGGGLSPEDAAKAVIYDAASNMSNAPGNAFIRAIMGLVDEKMAAEQKRVAKAMAHLVGPLQKRLEATERAVDMQRTEVRDAIRSAVGGFLDEDPQDSPSMDELQRMAKDHRRMMAKEFGR